MSGGLLVVTAHPDDESLIAGGVLAACAARGAETGVLCLTRGEEGPIADGRATRKTLGQVRVGELRTACAELGVAWVKCYRRMDAHLPFANSTAVAHQIARAIDLLRPAAVVTFGADGLYDHPDHVAVRRFVGRAFALLHCRRPHLYEAVWPNTVMSQLVGVMAARGLPVDLWEIDPAEFGTPVENGTIAIDVRPFLPVKLRALRQHRTQLGADHLFSALPDDLAERFLGWERFRRVPSGGSRGDGLVELAGAQAAGD